MYQVLPIILVLGVVAISFVMRGKVRGKTTEMYADALSSLQADVANGRRPDEQQPIIFTAVERKMLSAKLYYVALSNRRMIIKRAGGDTQTFDRSAVQLSIRAKTFADVGNMQTTYSSGWELSVALPDHTNHKWRVYEQAEGIPDHAASVRSLITTLGAA